MRRDLQIDNHVVRGLQLDPDDMDSTAPFAITQIR